MSDGFVIDPGPHVPCFVEGGGLLPKILDGNEDNGPQDSDSSGLPSVSWADVWLSARPLGGGDSVAVLAPNTTYELHYAAEAESVSFYVVYLVAFGSSGNGPSIIETEGSEWPADNGVSASSSDALIGSPFFPQGWVRISGYSNGFWGNPASSAAASGHLLNFRTGEEVAIGLEVSIVSINLASGGLTVMDNTAAFLVDNEAE